MLSRILAISALLLAAVSATAQTAYPDRPIKLVVPFTPGSTSDITARAIAHKISGPLGQPVLVENKPGANGSVGMQSVAKSRPDGYTLIIGSVSSTVVPSIITKNVPFDLLNDFTPVSTIANTALVLTVAKESPISNVADLVSAAKKAPGTLTYGNSAGLYQLAMEALNQQAGIDLQGIAYKGPADALNDLLGGRLSVNPDSLGSATRMIQSGRVRALAVLGAKRDEALPAVPTMQELGYKDFAFNGWIGILAPAGTPETIIERLHREIANAVASEEIRSLYRNAMLEAVSLSPKGYREAMVQDLARYQRIARVAGIEKQ